MRVYLGTVLTWILDSMKGRVLMSSSHSMFQDKLKNKKLFPCNPKLNPSLRGSNKGQSSAPLLTTLARAELDPHMFAQSQEQPAMVL